MTGKSDFREDEIAALTMEILTELRGKDAEIDIKVAALRGAAEVLQQAVSRKLLAVSMFNALNPPRR